MFQQSPVIRRSATRRRTKRGLTPRRVAVSLIVSNDRVGAVSRSVVEVVSFMPREGGRPGQDATRGSAATWPGARRCCAPWSGAVVFTPSHAALSIAHTVPSPFGAAVGALSHLQSALAHPRLRGDGKHCTTSRQNDRHRLARCAKRTELTPLTRQLQTQTWRRSVRLRTRQSGRETLDRTTEHWRHPDFGACPG